MEQIQPSAKYGKQLKFRLVLPLLILPFVIILFVILGGGKGRDTSPSNPHTGGLNVKLPDAHFRKGNDKSKLSLYEEASKDSALLKERIRNDPYYLIEHHDSNVLGLSGHPDPDQNEKKIMDKLAQLKSVIHQKPEAPESEPKSLVHPDLKREELEKMLAGHSPSQTHDPELDQLTGMLNKAMALKYPELMRDSLNRLVQERKEAAYPVELNRPLEEPVSFGTENKDHKPQPVINRFYDLAENPTIENIKDNAIEAIIPESQTLVSGSTIGLRLLNDVRINGHVIAKDQYIYGTTSLSNERLRIQFSSIRSGNNILPVALEAYDLDGLAGIYIPGSINRDVAKQSGDQALGAIGLTSLDPSIGAQAAGAGIQAARTLISRKVRLIKVTVKAGYRVLLKDSK